MPIQGRTGYPSMIVNGCPGKRCCSCKAAIAKSNGVLPVACTESSRLCPAIKISPVMSMSRTGRNTITDNTIILKPSAHITCRIRSGNTGLKVQPNVISVISASTSHKPRVKRKKESYFLVFLIPFKKAEAPARKANMGAQ